MSSVEGRARQRLGARQGVTGMLREGRSQEGNVNLRVAAFIFAGLSRVATVQRMLSPRRALAVLSVGTALLLSGCGQGEPAMPEQAVADEETVIVEAPTAPQRLLDRQELTVLDQRITYPKKKPARISSETIILEPGGQTGWRSHKIPVYVHVLSGTYSVDYGEGAIVEYPAGTAFVQAMKTDYNGMNTTEEPVEVLHVYLGAKGLRDVIER